MKIIKKIGKWLGYGMLGLFLLALLLYGYVHWKIEQRLSRVYPTHTPSITIPTDSSAIARGKHLYVVHACKDCHQQDLKGRLMVDSPLLGRIAARNLTKGKGGLPADFNDQDWLRTLKHGVNREGKPLIIMPSHETTQITDKDLSDIIAFCKSQSPVDHEILEQQQIGPLLKIMAVFGGANIIPAEQIDHEVQSIAEIQPEATARYGQYLTVNCATCHRDNFQGGPALAPGYPAVPNITSTGRVGQWSETQFMHTLRTGITPDGHQMDSLIMPWSRTREFTELELKAVRAFLLSLPEE